MKIIKELLKVESLEKNYSILSSIGLRLILPKHDYEIEGFIQAPYNSIIKYPENYPNQSPRIYLKTTILHCNIIDDGYCCIVDPLLSNWKNIYELPSILSFLYQFFIYYNHMDHDNRELAELYKIDKSLFNKKCEDYMNLL